MVLDCGICRLRPWRRAVVKNGEIYDLMVFAKIR